LPPGVVTSLFTCVGPIKATWPDAISVVNE